MDKRQNHRATAGFLLIIAFMTGFFLTKSIIVSSMNYNSERAHSLYYFTIQSNIIVFFWFIFAGINLLSNQRIFKFALKPNFTAISTTYILITGIIYWGVLVPIFFKPGGGSDWLFTPSNIWLHTITPVAAVILLFLSKQLYEGPAPKRHFITFAVYPVLYLIFGLYNAFNGLYLYPMFNPEMLGNWGFVLLSLGAIFLVFSVFYLLLLKLYRKKQP